MTHILIIVLCALLYALKGGSGASIFKNWNAVRDKNKILERLLDGKIISTLGMFILAILLTADPYYAIALPAAWLVAIAPSMGEEHGAVGRYKHAWGEYIDKDFGRAYGIKKALQRGVWMGAAMTLATGFTPFILASLLFVPCIFLGQDLNHRILKHEGWTLAEPLIGACVFGLPLAMWGTIQ